MTLSETIELISKAMEVVTPGRWNDHREIRLRGQHDVGLNLSFVNCEHGSRTDREARANAAYLAACSPDRMREVLAAAREAEAMKREIAEKDARIADLEEALKQVADKYTDITPTAQEVQDGARHPDRMADDDLALITIGIGHLRRARALLSKESDDAAGSAITTTGTGGGE